MKNHQQLVTKRYKADVGPDVTAMIHHCAEVKSLDDLAGKSGFLMISIKNKLFTNRLIEAFICFSTRHFSNACITLVSKPYIQNIYARHSDERTIQKERDKLAKILKENEARVKRLIQNNGLDKVKLVAWDNLENATPKWIADEVEQAFLLKGRFYQDIIDRTYEVMPDGVVNDDNAEKYAQFLIRELPVLLHHYYFMDDEIVDVYPGENPDFIWKFETGHYQDELPGISEAACKGSGLIYIDFQMKPSGS